MPRCHALPLAALLAGAALLASGCSLADLTGTGTDRPRPEERAAPPPPALPAPALPAPALRARPRPPRRTWTTGALVRVVMNDRFRYRPSAIMVRAGARVTFAVTNVGKLPHEFILGSRATQLDHERQMRAAGPDGAHAHAHGPAAQSSRHASGAVSVPPGETRRLVWTFDEPGLVLYGCHVVGHWAAGMKGTIMVLAPDRPSRPRTPLPLRPPPPARQPREDRRTRPDRW